MKTKTKSNRAKQFNSRQAAYSATAGVALLAAPAAQATIFNITSFSYDNGTTFTTTPPDVTGNPANQQNEIDFTGATAGLAHGFHGALLVENRSNSISHEGVAVMEAGSGIVATSVRFGSVNVPVVKDLDFGARIAGATNLRPFDWLAYKIQSGTVSHALGSFLPNGSKAAKTGYIGFQAGSYYGWLRVKVVNDSSGFPFELTLAGKDGIYGAIGLKSDNLTAGETAGTSSVPDQASSVELGGLALLALGAFGVREQRRRRQPTGTH